MSGGDGSTELESGDVASAGTQLESSRQGRGATHLETAPTTDHAFIAHNLPGELAGQVRIVRRLGVGAQGSVYLCERLSDGEQVAVKLYSLAMSRLDPSVMKLLASAPAGHIVPTEFGQWGDECWEIQEYLPLGTVVELAGHLGGELTDDVRTEVVHELAEAVAAAHDLGLLHRDIKPSNILVRSLDPLDLVLADFGLVRNLALGAQLGSRSATPGYRSPDTAQGIWRLESDWWAVGITLHEILCGRHPFDDENGYRQDDITILGFLVDHEVPIDEDLDARWRLLLRGLLTKRADERWGIDQVRRWLAGESPAVHAASPRAVRQGWTFSGFAGHRVHSTDELARLLRDHWADAAAYVSGRGRRALHDALAQTDDAERIHRLFGRFDHQLISTDVLLFELIRLLSPDDELVFRGRPLTGEGLADAAVEAGRDDAEAVDWVQHLRRSHVLSSTMGHELHDELVSIDQRLGDSWQSVREVTEQVKSSRQRFVAERCGGSGPSVDLDRLVADVQGGWEGDLLRAALDPPHAQALQDRTRQRLSNRAPEATWFAEAEQRLQVAAPQPGVALLLLALVSVAEGDAETARAVETERRREQAARERQAAQERRRARRRAAVPNGGDVSVVGAALAVCATVLVPWLLGRFAFVGAFGRDGRSDVIARAREEGAYFVTNWTAGCVVVLLAAAALLAVRALLGSRLGAGVLAAALVVPAVVLIPFTGREWDDAELATSKLGYDSYEMDDYFTCGGASSNTDPVWSVWTYRRESSDIQGCNRVKLFRGLTEVKQIDLDDDQQAGGISGGTPVMANGAADPADVVFTFTPDEGKKVKIKVSKYD